MITTDTFKRGVTNGITLIFSLAKIIIPIYIIMTFLEYTPILDYLSTLFTPFMKLFGLPGNAAIALVLGNLVNISAALGVIISLDMTVKQITIISVMLSFSHTLLIETAVSKKVGVSVLLVVGIRVSLAIVSGIVLNLVM